MRLLLANHAGQHDSYPLNHLVAHLLGQAGFDLLCQVAGIVWCILSEPGLMSGPSKPFGYFKSVLRLEVYAVTGLVPAHHHLAAFTNTDGNVGVAVDFLGHVPTLKIGAIDKSG